MLKTKGAACLDIHRQEGALCGSPVREQAQESLPPWNSGDSTLALALCTALRLCVGLKKGGPSYLFWGLPFPPLSTFMYWGSWGVCVGLGVVKAP